MQKTGIGKIVEYFPTCGTAVTVAFSHTQQKPVDEGVRKL
jgi:hypothetical protein